VRLAQAEEWLEKHADAPVLLKEFLEASRRARDEARRKEREAQERELARQQVLKQAAEARAEAEKQLREQAQRSTVRTRRFSYALGSMLGVFAAVAWFAFQQKSNAEFQQRMAESRALAAEAEQRLAGDRDSAFALAFRGWQTASLKISQKV
jgi:hypothetical protein